MPLDPHSTNILAQVVVRGGVIVTLISLVLMFGILFFHNWRAWDMSKTPGAGGPGNSVRINVEDVDMDDEEDPLLTRALLQTRRKSVSFSVCVMDEHNMSFDLERKKVLLGANSGSQQPFSSVCNLPTLEEGDDVSEDKVGGAV